MKSATFAIAFFYAMANGPASVDAGPPCCSWTRRFCQLGNPCPGASANGTVCTSCIDDNGNYYGWILEEDPSCKGQWEPCSEDDDCCGTDLTCGTLVKPQEANFTACLAPAAPSPTTAVPSSSPSASPAPTTGTAAPTDSAAPSASPSASPAPTSTTAAPTDSAAPSSSPSASPAPTTSTDAPTESAAPSSSPSASPAPTATTAAPTDSAAPSSSPSASPAPTMATGAPTVATATPSSSPSASPAPTVATAAPSSSPSASPAPTDSPGPPGPDVGCCSWDRKRCMGGNPCPGAKERKTACTSCTDRAGNYYGWILEEDTSCIGTMTPCAETEDCCGSDLTCNSTKPYLGGNSFKACVPPAAPSRRMLRAEDGHTP